VENGKKKKKVTRERGVGLLNASFPHNSYELCPINPKKKKKKSRRELNCLTKLLKCNFYLFIVM
jgi:hypothetical protein